MCASHQHKAARPAKKQKATTFIIDCSKPVDDGIMKMDAFERYLQGRMKVNGLLGEDVRVSRDRSKVAVTTHMHMAKRYLKYLTKKFLKNVTGCG